jgi:guanylate kinase
MVLERIEGLAYSVSATTRKRREGEVDGEDYIFIDRKTFRRWIEEKKLIEWSEVYGELYGTPFEPVKRHLDGGRDVLLDLDYNGKVSLEKLFAGRVVSIFLIPPNLDELKERLIKRGVESKEKLKIRMDKMLEEMRFATEYDYWVLNDERELAASRVEAIITAERMKRKRLSREILRDLGVQFPPSHEEE